MMPPLSVSKIILATIVQTIALSGIYFYSLYYRLRRVNPQDYAACVNENLREFQACANQTLLAHLTDSGWLAVQFTLVVVPATIITYLFCHRGIGRPFTQAAIIAGLTIIGLTLVMKQGALAALAAALGILLGGLLAKRRLDRVIIFNQKPPE